MLPTLGSALQPVGPSGCCLGQQQVQPYGCNLLKHQGAEKTRKSDRSSKWKTCMKPLRSQAARGYTGDHVCEIDTICFDVFDVHIARGIAARFGSVHLMSPALHACNL